MKKYRKIISQIAMREPSTETLVMYNGYYSVKVTAFLMKSNEVLQRNCDLK